MSFQPSFVCHSIHSGSRSNPRSRESLRVASWTSGAYCRSNASVRRVNGPRMAIAPTTRSLRSMIGAATAAPPSTVSPALIKYPRRRMRIKSAKISSLAGTRVALRRASCFSQMFSTLCRGMKAIMTRPEAPTYIGQMLPTPARAGAGVAPGLHRHACAPTPKGRQGRQFPLSDATAHPDRDGTSGASRDTFPPISNGPGKTTS